MEITTKDNVAKKAFKRLIKMTIAALAIAALSYGLFYTKNNSGGGELTAKDIQASHDASVDWMLKNQQLLLDSHNPGLWEMVSKTIDLTDNKNLEALLKRYQSEHYSRYLQAPLRFQIYGENGNIDFRDVELHAFPYYNVLFMYGATCDSYLEQLLTVQQQLSADFCRSYYPISPACKTHQLMGFILLEKSNCQEPEQRKKVMNYLSKSIQTQLRFDFRVVDVYLQRAMMLLEMQRYDLINTSWINNIVRHQNIDGGWDDCMPLIPLGETKSFSICAKSFQVTQPDSIFHATAQGALLTAYALQKNALLKLGIDEI